MKTGIISENTKKYGKGEKNMIIMNLELDNFFAFRNFKLNMSYPKKIVDSSIENEFLTGRENFRYKKVNILMGANATGKTSIGKMLMRIFNFIDKKEASRITEVIEDSGRQAEFSMDFVTESYQLYRLNVIAHPVEQPEDTPALEVCTRSVKINKADSYELCVKKIENIPCIYQKDYGEELEKIDGLGWMFSYLLEIEQGVLRCPRNPLYPQILDHTLRALDPSIEKVDKLDGVENTFVIRSKEHNLVMQDGKVIHNDILSSGTRAGIDIAGMIAAMQEGECGFYYCDEKFSYIHSDMEKAFLSIMIDAIKENEQLFFTTHNMDVLDMHLPKHTYVFLKKDVNDEEHPIQCISASQYLKRSTDSVRNAVENDLFSVAPNLELIYEIADMHN